MNSHTNRICLGTAQFGLDYGIANTHGRMSEEDVKSVLKYATAHGVKVLDTAAAYGNSEEAIGRSLKHLNRSLDVVSKLPSSSDGKASVRDTVLRSLKRLGVKKIYGYLLHSFEDYRRPEIWKDLNALKAEGIIEKVGVSVYLPKEADQLLKDKAAIDILQVPYSVFDRRFESYLPQFKKMGVEIYVRSVFLQGLAFLEPNKLPASLTGARSSLNALRKISIKGGMTVSALCLNFALINPHVDRVIIGVDNPEHLKVNLSDMRFFAKTKTVGEDFNMVVIEDEDILLPYRWKR
jgi:aryl-alcohol dehydrogenase-like predicted oxidoreductase